MSTTARIPGPIGRVVRWPPSGAGGRARRWSATTVAYRRIWVVLISGFFEPVFYLFSLGVGLDELVGPVAAPGGRAISYTAFVAPGLLASSAMNGGVYEVTNIFWKLKYAKLYDAMLATPMALGDVALGEMLTASPRRLYSAVLRGGHRRHGTHRVLVGPGDAARGDAYRVRVLDGGSAATTYMRSWQDMELVQVVLMPLFLFSATFYPLATYSRPLQFVVQCTPLYHGVALERELAVGALGLGTLVHVAYLVALGAWGLVVTGRRMEKLMLKGVARYGASLPKRSPG